MDFGRLLHTAQKNDKTSKNGVRYYSTKFEPPKKEKKSKELSNNIKKFLAKKEAEEKLKADQEKKKREELLALRAQDKKATRRVNVMLKRTKSANQSVIEDAVDEDNTAVTLAGPLQPDEDDYGYVSQEASAFYNKMMEKYSKMPDEPKFDLTKKKVSTNLSSTKDRVRAALEKEKEEAMMPHRRKRKHKESKEDEDEDGISYRAPERPEKADDLKEPARPQPPPPKKHRPPPPVMNFADLLKIAEKKQFEPIVIEKKEKEDEKLLTKRQRREIEKEHEYLRQKDARREAEKTRMAPPGASNSNRIPKISEKPGRQPEKVHKVERRPQSSEARIPKLNHAKPSSHPSAKPRNSDAIRKPSSSVDRPGTSSTSIPLKSGNKPSGRDQEILRNCLKDRPLVNGKAKDAPFKKPQPEEPQKKYLPGDLRYKQSTEEEPQKKYLPGDTRYKPTIDDKPKQFPPADVKAKGKQFSSKDVRTKPGDVKPRQLPPNDVRPKQFPPSDLKPKKFPPGDVKPKQFPPKDLKTKQFPPPDMRGVHKKRPVMVKKGRILDDDDSEYDSEMDDFIDDDDAGEDYSKYINEIFGYDKSKYRDVDDDVDNMESSFAQQMREEVISKKIGIMEDLEDMKMEEEEKKRKVMMKKRKN